MMSLQEVVEKYDSLTRPAKGQLIKDFCRKFNYKNSDSLRVRLKGKQPFLVLHIEWLEENFPKYELVQIPEIVSEK